MECPHIYYKRAIQYFAYAIAYMEGSEFAEELLEETSEEKLETFILNNKEQMNEKLFYYDAGRASQSVIEEGCDPLNASLGGIEEFEDFIGLNAKT